MISESFSVIHRISFSGSILENAKEKTAKAIPNNPSEGRILFKVALTRMETYKDSNVEQNQ